LSHEVRLFASWWPGGLEADVHSFWTELEYQPRVTARVARLSAIGEVLLRGAVSGLAAASDGDAVKALRVQSDRNAVLVKQLSVAVDTPVDVVIGWQVLSWGHATDGVRPLDVFQRLDLTDRIRPEQLGVASVSASYGRGPWEVEAVWVPSSPRDAFATRPSNVWYAFPRGTGSGSVVETGRNAFTLAKAEGGARASWYGQDGDVAVMVARTRDRVPSVVELHRASPLAPLQSHPRYEPYWLVGASVVRTAGNYVLRAEGLHARYGNDRPATVLQNGFRGVAGVERRLASTNSRFTFIGQYATDTTGSAAVRQEGIYLSSPFRVYRHALTGSMVATWRERYETEVRALTELNGGSLVTSGKFSLRQSDRLTMWIGADLVSGGTGTWLERLGAADRVLLGITVKP
jgi:hypothetical protein